MSDAQYIAELFDQNRLRLRTIAYRMLGSINEADDAVQEAWLRLSRSGAGNVENLGGWLTTVVSRVCLDMLRARASRREEPLERHEPDPVPARGTDPEREAVLADSIGPALLLVLETLSPAERVAFVLHDVFAVPFDEIAPIVGRSAVATRQLASRARRAVQNAGAVSSGDDARRREIVSAFLAASRDGNFEALLALLDPNVVVRADAAAVRTGAQAEVRGAVAVAETFKGRARAAQLALIDGLAGLVWASGGRPRVAFSFAISDGKIAGIDLIADAEHLESLQLEMLGD